MNGQIVSAVDGRGIDGVPVDIIRLAGAATARDTLSTTTSDGGFWRIDAPTTAPGDIVLNVRVHTPSLANPYVIEGLHVGTENRRGEALQLGRWIANPYYAYYLYLVDSATNTPFPFTQIRFHQRAGPRMTGLDANGDITMTSDPYGVAQLFLFNTFATDTGVVVLDALANLPPPYGPTEIDGFYLSPTHLFRPLGPYVTIPVTPPHGPRNARVSAGPRFAPALREPTRPSRAFQE